MSARPWMPLYVGDYLADTTHLSTVQHGAYLLLIMRYWQHGCLPDDDSQLARIAGMSLTEWNRNKSALRTFFRKGWKHARIEREISDAKAAYERRAKAGQKGGRSGNRSKNPASNAQAMLKQSQSQSHPLRGSNIQGGKKAEGLAQGQEGGRPRLSVVNGSVPGDGEDEL